MLDGAIETTRVPRNPLDVLAQQIVAMCRRSRWTVDELYATCAAAPTTSRRCARRLFEGVLDMLAGRYPSDEFAELKAAARSGTASTGTVVGARATRASWPSPAAGRSPNAACTASSWSATGTPGRRVGELDEEMVYESRAGRDVRARRQHLAHRADHAAAGDRLAGARRAGQDAVLARRRRRPADRARPGAGRVRRARSGRPGADRGRTARWRRSRDEHDLDALAARNLLAYLAEQSAVTGAVPSDRTIVVERFRDELGDWRVCVLTPFGGRVHAPWALAIGRRIARAAGRRA